MLTGVIAGNDAQNGLAIIGQSAQATKVYAVGDTVPGGVKLHAVYEDRVILDDNGELQTLALPRNLNPALAPPPFRRTAAGGREPLVRARAAHDQRAAGADRGRGAPAAGG